MKGCVNRREARLRALRAQATRAARTNITKAELKELQRLLALQPQALSDDQKLRMAELKEKFERTMPAGSSPMPTASHQPSDHQMPDFPTGPSSSTSGRNKQPRTGTSISTSTELKETKDQSTQADYVPAFNRVDPPPRVQREVVAGPFFHTQGGKLHLYRECWGLRNAGNVQQSVLCRCCVENAGQRIY